MSGWDKLSEIRWHYNLAWIIRKSSIPIRTFCECGVGPLDIASSPLIHDHRLAERLVLVEPNPDLYRMAKERMPRADIFNVGVSDCDGEISLVLNGGSSYIQGKWAPTPHDGKTATIKTMPFDRIDDGRIDCLVLDCEGQEWEVLKKMRSRPLIISVEIWKTHPHRGEILSWLQAWGYEPIFTTGPEGETLVLASQSLRLT